MTSFPYKANRVRKCGVVVKHYIGWRCKKCRPKLTLEVKLAEADKVMRRRYGIGQQEKESLLIAQGGVCVCCSSPNPRSKQGWHVDHDHKTGGIRGILCSPCNVTLGMVEDSTKRLEQLICYLKRVPHHD